MPFRPVVRSSLAFNNNQYLFTEHPSAKGMAYGQTGRRATVYQVVDGNGRYYALKVFTLAFRNPRTETNAQKLQAFADLPGLQVCTRLTITLQAHASLVQQYPDLQYAVLMPWIEGQTWQEVMLSGQSFSKQQTHILAQWLVCVLAVLEQRGLAHCDLSGPNILLPGLPTLSNVSQNTLITH